MAQFKLVSPYKPTGDQPQAIKEITEGFKNDIHHQVLLGVTGSGKTFTMANVIQNLNKPTLVLSHNKTLAAQLYNEFKAFFPENAVEYFVSYYDYYQPEAYLPISDTYIEKDLAINDEIEKLRLSTTSQLLSGRSDVIVVSSVSCIYGIGNPDDFKDKRIYLEKGMTLDRNEFLRQLVSIHYVRNEIDFKRGSFRVKGDTVDIYLAYTESVFRLLFWDDEIESMELLEPDTMQASSMPETYFVYPANLFVTTQERINRAVDEIALDLGKEKAAFIDEGKPYEAKRLEERTNYDLEMIKEVGYCSGVENYSRYFDGRPKGSRPFCLLDFFPDDFTLMVDESHVTIPQIRAMSGGDAARKRNLVDYGFRLSSAKDNRPLRFDEFDALVQNALFVSATPADYELEKTGGVIVEQIIRPTGLLDPVIDVRPSHHQIDDLLNEISLRSAKDERVLVTTLTKRMAEELDKYFTKMGVKCRYIHSEVETMERVEIINGLRHGAYDVLIGVNLLREGLDLPEVSLVAILDADKEGFLRNHRSLTQTAGRAARNVNGLVIMYADKMTKSMRQTIDETNRRREIQMKYNEDHHMTPQPILRKDVEYLVTRPSGHDFDMPGRAAEKAAEIVGTYQEGESIHVTIRRVTQRMNEASKRFEFLEAAKYRDELIKLEARRDVLADEAKKKSSSH